MAALSELPAPGTHQPPRPFAPSLPGSDGVSDAGTLTPDATDLSVTASAPHAVRIGGLEEVMERLEGDVGDATCEFGPAGDDADVVPCVCDAAAGHMECAVPEARGMQFNGEGLHVRARIGEKFESPTLYMKYRVERGDSDSDKNVVLYGADSHLAPGKLRSWQVKVLEKVTGEGDATRAKRYSIWHQCIAEAVGVAIIVVFGVGSVCSAILFPGGLTGLWQVAVVWGFGVALAIASTASVSGGVFSSENMSALCWHAQSITGRGKLESDCCVWFSFFGMGFCLPACTARGYFYLGSTSEPGGVSRVRTTKAARLPMAETAPLLARAVHRGDNWRRVQPDGIRQPDPAF